MVRKVVGNNHSFYYELYHIENFERIMQWNVNHIRKLLDLDNLINYGDFAKFSVLINCYLSLKKNSGHELSDKEISTLLEGLESYDSKKVYRYTLCYNYQNLKYLAQNKSAVFSKALLEEETFDMSALVLCILHSAYVFPELVDAVKDKYLFLIGNGWKSILDPCIINHLQHTIKWDRHLS